LEPESLLSDRPQFEARQAEEHEVQTLLDVVRQTCLELHQDQQPAVAVTLDSSLDRDLGLDSLARVELLLRVERAFGVALPENTLQLTETPRDLLRALGAAGQTTQTVPAVQSRRVLLTPGETSAAQPDAAATLLDVLDWHVREHADQTYIVLLADSGEVRITYAGLKTTAASVAASLQKEGLERNQTVAIMLPTSPEYFYAFFGVLLAGGIPVPIYPPARLSQVNEHVRRHAAILRNAEAVMLVTAPETIAAARLLQGEVTGLRRVLAAGDLATERGDPHPVSVSAGDIAFLQYTSGSTGDPKGVVLTHANLLANIRAMAQALQASSRDVFISWLPLYHDMGLIGACLGSLYVGFPLVLMSSLAFLNQPQRWLWAIDRYRGTLTAAPNFAFELCLNRIDPNRLKGLDLSSLRFMANGAEKVSPETIERFSAHFSAYGLDPKAIAPVFGLAESAVGLLFPPLGRGAVIDRVRRQAFMQDGKALPAEPDDPNPLRFVACGRPLPRHDVRIVDEFGQELGERLEGRLEFRGPSATSGYYRNPEQTRRLIHDGWLDTGDKAYLAEDDVYLTGRIKDVIIRGGRNIHPHELEDAIAVLPGIRKGCVAVFGTADPRTGTERLVVLAETRESEPAARNALRDAISRIALDLLGDPADEIVLAPPHTVLKTSSGKIRRSATRELYEAGLADARSLAARWQVVRLLGSAALSELRRRLRLIGRWLHGCYAEMLFWLFAAPTWALTALMPRPEWAWTLNHFAARLVFRLSGTALVVRGLKHLPDSATVVVSNHASYLDGVILTAALPRHHAFVVKRELRDYFLTRIFFERLGAAFVERFAAQQSVEDANRLALAATEGRSLLFFPEGTFTPAPGLLPFHLGAFMVAARAGVPVVPISIRGSRAVLRDGRWLPQPGPIKVTIGAPIPPSPEAKDAFAAAVRMRDLARTEILRHCGEAKARPAR
jgi:acyl carrier protein